MVVRLDNSVLCGEEDNHEVVMGQNTVADVSSALALILLLIHPIPYC